MRRPAFALCIATLALAALPAADAASALLAFSDTFGAATMDVEGTIEGGDAAQLRSIMDLTGNRDGQVSQDEADRFLDSGRDELGARAGRVLTDGNLTMDGEPLAGSELQTLVLRNATGPVQGGPPITFEANLTFFFQPSPGATSHVLALEGRPTPGGALRMTFMAPAGWQANATVSGAAVPQADATSPAVDMPTDGGKVVVTFTPTPLANESPGLGGALSIAVLAVATWVSRGAAGLAAVSNIAKTAHQGPSR